MSPELFLTTTSYFAPDSVPHNTIFDEFIVFSLTLKHKQCIIRVVPKLSVC